MDKNQLLTLHGKSKVNQVAGILHNYTPNGTMEEALQIEKLCRKYGQDRLADVFPHFEEHLELN